MKKRKSTQINQIKNGYGELTVVITTIFFNHGKTLQTNVLQYI